MIAVLCALDWELAHLRRVLPAAVEDQSWQFGGARPWRGALAGQQLLLVRCGMGMLSAAACTEAVIGRYAPSAVLNYGCAGAHRAELLPGDLVVATQVIAYDSVRESPHGELSYRGMHYLKDGQQQRVEAVASDPVLLDAAQRAAEAVQDRHEPWPLHLGWPAETPHRPPRVVFGTVLSADRWNRAPATIAGLVARHGSLCEDMEAAAIGVVCGSHGVPFLSIKDISNNELLRSTSTGPALLAEVGPQQLARRAAAFTLAVLQALAPSRPPGQPSRSPSP